jgi:single-strand DNA-binding protein
MPSLNQVTLIGHLTRDPESKFLPNGSAVCNFGMALNRTYKGSNGEKKEEVTFVSIETWGKTAEACGEHLKKGSLVLVEGRLKLREWTSQDGQKRSMLDVVAERVQFLDKRGSRTESAETATDETPIPF